MAFWVTDRIGKMVWASQKWQDDFDLEMKFIKGKSDRHWVHPDDYMRLATSREFAISRLLPFSAMFSHRHGTNSWTLSLTTSEPIIENGVWRGYRGITERINPRNLLMQLSDQEVAINRILKAALLVTVAPC